MAVVEFIYEKNCPNIALARAQLLQAFSRLKIKPHWLEWEINDADAPAYARQCGSPTIMVDGKDVDGASLSDNTNHCRVYRHSDNTSSGVPAVDSIIHAIQKHHRGNGWFSRLFDFRLTAATLPAMILALLPKLICPFCWPLYTGLLGLFGINFINYTPYLLPLLTLFLILTVSGLALGVRSTRQVGPLLLGSLSALLILGDKLLFETNFLIYGGLGMLIIAVVWHSRVQFLLGQNACPACENATDIVTHPPST